MNGEEFPNAELCPLKWKVQPLGRRRLGLDWADARDFRGTSESDNTGSSFVVAAFIGAGCDVAGRGMDPRSHQGE
jgi:hypothetical protein